MDINYTGNFTNKKERIDKYIFEKYLQKENGIFIEAGANDGITQSNTYILEKYYGWKGICIEPCIKEYIKCSKIRNSYNYNCALVSFDYNNATVKMDIDGGLMASINGKRLNSPYLYDVSSNTLQNILDELNLHNIDFFSLDVEGFELDVLKGIDFNKTNITYCLIEYNPSLFNELMQFMIINKYEFIENVSNYSLETNPGWDGLHNDYLFKRV